MTVAVDKLRIKTLGGLSIERSGESVGDFASSKAEALLVYLAGTRREHPREVLADLLWDDRTQRQALANLRVVLSSLRKEVGPFVSITRNTAAIDGEADVWLDVVQLEAAVEAAQEVEEAPSAKAVEALEQALALYEGDFLAGFFLPEASGFEAWAAGERERLHRLALDALQRLGRWHLAQADYSAAIATSTRLVQLGPLAEVGHRQLMEALARNGQRAEALAQYEMCREVLAEELGVEPQEKTRTLYEAIRQDRLGAARAQAARPQAVTSSLPDFLASPGRETEREILFVGREEALAQLGAHLQEALAGRGRAVFLSGETGMGKTSLAQEFAWRATEAEPQLVVALGRGSTLSAGDGAYRPFRQIMALLCGGVEEGLASGDLGQEQAWRLWHLMPRTAQIIVEEGPNLPGLFFNGSSLLSRLNSALPYRAPWLTRLEKVVEQASAIPGDLERSTLHDQLAAVLRALAQDRPLLVILEDIHWAGRATIDLLFQLAKGLGPSPILFLATYRPEEVHGVAGAERPLLKKVLAEFKRDFGDVVIDLDEIGRAEGRAFVDELVDSRPNDLGESFRQALYRRTRGHPLFTVELLRALRQRGDLQRDEEGRWRSTTEIEWTELPAQTEGVLEERLARLQPVWRELLEVASVEGETFTAQVVAGVLGQNERQVVRVLSGPLEREQSLVQSLGTRRLGGQRLSRFRFRHEFFRKYLYDSLAEVERSYLHEDVGHAIENLYEGQEERFAGQLAWHFTEAGLAEKGISYSLQAGDRARLDYAHEEAADHYENALDFLRERKDDNQIGRTLMKLGLTYQMALKYRDARRTFEEAFTVWQRAQSHVERSRVPAAPHRFRIPYIVEPETLDPTSHTSVLANVIISQLFSGLIENRGGTVLIPDVARRWETHDGGRTVVYHLREDARWSDGHPLTAEDFVLSWRRLLDPECAKGITDSKLYDIQAARNYARGEVPAEALGVRALDANTLVVELERPSGPFLNLVHHPVPAHVVRRHGEAWAKPEHLVTNGPFRLVRWRPDQEIVFERNPHYHGSYPGNVENVEYLSVDEGSDAVKLYENDELDVLHSYLLTPQEFRRVRQRFAADYVSAPRLQTIVLCFNLKRPPFQDPRVRRALALAIDREKLADVDLNGLLFPASGGMVPPGMAGHTPDSNLAYAPQRARELLAEAGYAGGIKFPRVEAWAPGSVAWHAIIQESIQRQWQNVLGLDIPVQPTEWVAVADAQLFITGWAAGGEDDPSHFLDTFARVLGYSGKSEALDGLLARARETIEPGVRLELYRRADRLLVQEVLLSPLLYGRAHYSVKPWVHGYLPGTRWKDLIIEPH